jgi:acyl CoA:acetate/3-ketoacid CoA transferase beta subunit
MLGKRILEQWLREVKTAIMLTGIGIPTLVANYVRTDIIVSFKA